MINILVAYDQTGGIGSGNDLPWGRGLPGDLKRFKELTNGHSVVMGRKTYESIGHPLPDRENIVITRSPNLQIDEVMCVNSLAQAIGIATREVFIIGGGQIYAEALDKTDRIYATEIQAAFPAVDAFFPPIDEAVWDEVSREIQHRGNDQGDLYDYDFVIYERAG